MTYKENALAFLGVTRWHEAGYTGKGIKILSDEKVCEKKHPDVISPAGFKSKQSHGDNVMSYIKLVAPDAELIAYPFSGSFGDRTYSCKCAEYIKENKVHIFTTSCLGSYPNKGKQNAIQDCIQAGCIFFAAAGNDGKKGLLGESKYEGYFAIGGAKPTFTGEYDGEEAIRDWNDIHRVKYSAVGEELDYVTIAEIVGGSGTSFCAPVFAAMVGLVQQFFAEKVGRRLKRLEMERFIKDNLIDIEEEGFDVQTGHGLFVLPEPSTIDVNKYAISEGTDYSGFPQVGGEDMKAELQIDNKIVVINGEKHTYDTAPFIKDNRTFVPVRFLEDMGFAVEWNANERKVLITKED